MVNIFNIPGYKNDRDLAFAESMCKKLPYKSIILEIGALAGRTTAMLCKSTVNKESTVYAMDHWNGVRQFTGKGFNLDPLQRNTLEFFMQHVDEFTNLIPIKADSLTYEWNNGYIDLLVLDPDEGHSRTDLYEHLSIWYNRVRKNRWIMGYNFYEHRPDVRNAVIKFSEDNNTELLVNESGGWKMQRK